MSGCAFGARGHEQHCCLRETLFTALSICEVKSRKTREQQPSLGAPPEPASIQYDVVLIWRDRCPMVGALLHTRSCWSWSSVVYGRHELDFFFFFFLSSQPGMYNQIHRTELKHEKTHRARPLPPALPYPCRVLCSILFFSIPIPLSFAPSVAALKAPPLLSTGRLRRGTCLWCGC